MLKEFKEFAMRGNVLDMAIGVIMGAAFSNIINSLVNDIIMPLIGLLMGDIDLTTLSVRFGAGENAAILTYGNFIKYVINFFIIAFCLFLMVKAINAFRNNLSPFGQKEKSQEKPARLCPYCIQAVDEKASRCPHCTSELPLASTQSS